MLRLIPILIILLLSSCQFVQTSPGAKSPVTNGSGAVATENLPDYSQFFQEGRYSIFSMNPDGSDLKEIANYHKERDQIDISPDGKKILYVEYTEDLNKDGLANSEDLLSSEIGIMKIDGSEAYFPSTSPEIDINPAFSPDGKFIIFSSSRETGYRYLNFDLYSIELGSNKLRQITKTTLTAETHPAWTGNTIAYTYFDIRSQRQSAGLKYMDEDGSKVKTLSDPEIPGSNTDQRFGDYDIQISPDGEIIAFTRYLDNYLLHRGQKLGDHDIYLTNFSGTKLVNISQNKMADLDPSFSPDSKKIIFCRKDEESSELFLYDLASGKTEALVIPHWNALKSHPTFGPDGKIYFVGEKL